MATKSTNRAAAKDADRNADPITDEAGAHPVGVGVGAALGGAAAGAAAGAVAGPVGAAIGAAAGAVAGGLAGKGVAESLDPTVEDAYWRDAYRSRPYYEQGTEYTQYQPAYRYGWEAQERNRGKTFDEVEAELESGWATAKSSSSMDWKKARVATRDAWERAHGARR